MIVPNYVPDPLEVPANVTVAPAPARVWFVRRVTALFIASTLLVGGMVQIPFPRVGLGTTFGLFAAALIALDLWRVVARGKPIEARVSSTLLPVLLLAVAWNLRELRDLGWPIWQWYAGPCCMGVYTLLCGRDYSFVGNYVLSLVASTGAVVAYCELAKLPATATAFALVTSAVLLSYLVYDLASLLSRRRLDEEIASVTDLYRDVFNFPSYAIRVIRHWRKYKLFSLPPEIRWKT